MNEASIFDEVDEEEEARLDEEAYQDVLAGRFISNEAVMRWLQSLGTENELPPPQVGD